MDYAEFYYNQVVGHYPFDTRDELERTDKVVKHLMDAGISDQDILRFIEESPAKDYLTPDDLPDWLWEDSLLQRDTFYYHNTLHIKSPAPVFNPHLKSETKTDFFLEMKIRYTMDDLIRYFYTTLQITSEMSDKKKDTGSFHYLINKYDRLNFCTGIDFVLSLIDHSKPTGARLFGVQNIFDITDGEQEVYDSLKRRAAEAELHKADQIIWR